VIQVDDSETRAFVLVASVPIELAASRTTVLAITIAILIVLVVVIVVIAFSTLAVIVIIVIAPLAMAVSPVVVIGPRWSHGEGKGTDDEGNEEQQVIFKHKRPRYFGVFTTQAY